MNLLRNFFGQMTDTIWSSDSIRTIEHTGDKDESIAGIPRGVDPFFPHKCVGGVPGTINIWHGRTDNDGDEYACDDQETTNVTSHWERFVSEHDQSAAQPNANQITDKYVP